MQFYRLLFLAGFAATTVCAATITSGFVRPEGGARAVGPFLINGQNSITFTVDGRTEEPPKLSSVASPSVLQASR
jgi:hypothetical protein